MSGAEQQADAAAAEEDSAEAVVGITEYANDAAGFVAVLKQRRAAACMAASPRSGARAGAPRTHAPRAPGLATLS